MTPSNDDKTTQMPSVDETTPLPTTPGQDATVEMPASSPQNSSDDPLAIFREAPTAQMPADPFRADSDAAGQAAAPSTEGARAQAGSPTGSVGSGGRTAFDPASTGESTPQGHKAEPGAGSQTSSDGSPVAGTAGKGASPGTQTWSAQQSYGATYPLPEAPSRGVRVGAFVWAIFVCMVGAFLIAETYIASLNLPILGISAVAGLGVILIVTALLSGRSPKKPEARATAATSAPEDAIRKD